MDLLLLEDQHLVALRGVPQIEPQKKPIELRLGKGKGTLVFDRILCCQNDERRRKSIGCAVDGYLPLFHRFEQCRLSLWRRSIDLVGKNNLRDDWTGPKL